MVPLHKRRGEPPGTMMPTLILEVLNLQHDSSLGERTLELREDGEGRGDVRNGNRELQKRGRELIPL